MNVSAGKLDKRISIRAQSTARDSLNQLVGTWTEITNGAVWAAVQPIRNSEAMQAMANQMETTHRVTIRYRTDVTAAHRVYYGTRQFAIEGIRNPDERGEYLELTCVEGKNV